MKLFKKILPLLIFFIILIPLIWPLIQPGFFKSDDGEWMVIRLTAFHQTLRDGQFPVRFLERLNHNYGYPVLDFLYPLPFYLGEIIHLVGFNFVDSIKVLFILGFLGGALGMYLFVNHLYGRKSGIVAAIVYSYLPYRLFDTYQRGSIGECVAFIFAPFVLFFLRKFILERETKAILFASISYAAMLTSHNTLALLFTPVILGYNIILGHNLFDKRDVVKNSVIFYLLAIALSCWFWLPAIFDLQYTKASTVNVADFRNYFLGIDNQMSLLGVAMPLIMLFLIWIKKTAEIIFWALVLVCSLFFSSAGSAFFWQLGVLPKLVQFPWRFLALAVFSGAVLSGVVANHYKNRVLMCGFVGVVMILGFLQLKVDRVFRDESYYTTNEDTTTVQNEYMPKWVVGSLNYRPAKSIIEQRDKIIVNQVYFPGQTVQVDGIDTKTIPSQQGFLSIDRPQGVHTFKVIFKETPLHLLADMVSLLAGLVVVGMLIFRKRFNVE